MSKAMDSTILIPLLFPMEPPFEDLTDGSLIRVIRPDDEHIGVLQVTRQTEANRFGALVRFGPFSRTGHSTPPTSDQGFVGTGHSGLPIHRLTLEELHEIERTGDPEVPFALAVLHP